jgi:hypothetical protein
MSRHKEKDTVEHYRGLDVRALHRAGVLIAGWSGNWTWSRNGERLAEISIKVESQTCLRLSYQATSNGRTEAKDYEVQITWADCHLGGKRPWFACPSCGRRVAILLGGAVFACRQCRRLNYASQQVSQRDRAFERSWKLRHNLGVELGMYDFPAEYLSRPKGMHWQTFNRKIAELKQVEGRALADFEAVLASLERRLKALG